MSQTRQKEGNKRQYTLNMALAAMASQVGCVTLLFVVVALLTGLWLDNRFDTSPLFLASLLIASVPITVVVMLWIVRSITARIKPTSESIFKNTQEEGNRGTDPRST